jgi:opacity protein-like surface antigen
MNTACAAALAGLILCAARPAAAQDKFVTTFVPETQRHWDVAGSVGWRGVNKSDVAPSWNDWYDVAIFSASAGRYITPHIKIDVDLSNTTTGRVFGENLVGIPAAVSYYRFREFGRGTAAATLAYQFFENRWVHPFLGAGIEGAREKERIEVHLLSPIGPVPAILSTETHIRFSARPLVTGGVKAYASERAFIRGDVLLTLSSDGAESAVWRVGVGVDF